MADQPKDKETYSLLWISDMPLDSLLHGSTWINTTEELRKAGRIVTLVSPGSEGQNTIRGVQVLGIRRPEILALRHLVYQFRILKLIVSGLHSIDIVLFNELSAPMLFLLRFILRLIRRPFPLFIMDTRSLQMPPADKMSVKDKLKGFYLDAINALANYAADGRTAITSRMAQALKIPSNRLIGTWPSGVNLDAFSAVPAWYGTNLEDTPIKLIYTGSMHYERNLMALSRAIFRAGTQGMKLQLVLIGDGEEYRDLETYAAGTHGIIQVHPPIPHQDIACWLQRSHLGVLPFPDELKFQVSSPIKLFEYMAAGLPILATRIHCHEDVIKDGKYVFWTEGSSEEALFHSLQLAWSHRCDLENMGRLSASASKKWTWNKAADKLDDALLRALNNAALSSGARHSIGSSNLEQSHMGNHTGEDQMTGKKKET